MRQIITLGAGNTASFKFKLDAETLAWNVFVGMSGPAGANWDRLDKTMNGDVLTLEFRGLLKGDIRLGIMVEGTVPTFFDFTFV